MSDSKLNPKEPNKTHLEVIEVLTEYCGIGCEIPHKNVCVVHEVTGLDIGYRVFVEQPKKKVEEK